MEIDGFEEAGGLEDYIKDSVFLKIIFQRVWNFISGERSIAI